MAMHFDREKYLKIAQSQGVDAALTQLHHDTNLWEIDSFEGQKGWNPEQWRAIEEQVRTFSRELWATALKKGPQAPKA